MLFPNRFREIPNLVPTLENIGFAPGFRRLAASPGPEPRSAKPKG